MNNYEYMKNINIEQLSHFLCEAMEYLSEEEYYPCDRCPMHDRCREGANGWLDWLREERK